MKMSFQIYNWLEEYADEVVKTFGYRIWFIGLQGSYARGEATEASDIDIVLILDELRASDLRIYRRMLDTLSERERICGFVSGRAELENWDKSDLFQFCKDTVPIKGSLDAIFETIGTGDIERGIRTGACNIYHMACHNMIHEQQIGILADLYKAAVFVIQAQYYLKTGKYIGRATELFPKLSGQSREILYIAIAMKKAGERRKLTLDELSEKLIQWTSLVIRENTLV